MELKQHFHMNGGTGEASYSSNSFLQRKIISKTKPIMEEAILDMYSKHKSNSSKSAIGIADLGCSSGPNTLLVVSFVMDTIYKKCKELGDESQGLMVFLNDLPSNDFNTLFKSLKGFFDEGRQTKQEGFGPCFIAGMPGSFYGRLFPTASLHFVHSSYSLHWLSQVPKGIENSNKGSIWITKSSSSEVREAYLKQFRKDLWTFLGCRSEEVVTGGRMVLTFLGRISEGLCSKECYYALDLLNDVLNDMVLQGMIEEEKLDSLNLPIYVASLEEVKCVIEAEGSFIINQLSTFQADWDGEDAETHKIDKDKSGDVVANSIRAVYESLLVSHFGDGIIDELFNRYREIVADRMSWGKTTFTNICISMTKDSNYMTIEECMITR